MPSIYKNNYNYSFGKVQKIIDGKDILILSNGSILSNVIKACEILKLKNINPKLLNLHTLRPIDNSITNELKKFKNIISIEEHSIIGGMRSIILDIIAKIVLKPIFFLSH